MNQSAESDSIHALSPSCVIGDFDLLKDNQDYEKKVNGFLYSWTYIYTFTHAICINIPQIMAPVILVVVSGQVSTVAL